MASPNPLQHNNYSVFLEIYALIRLMYSAKVVVVVYATPMLATAVATTQTVTTITTVMKIFVLDLPVMINCRVPSLTYAVFLVTLDIPGMTLLTSTVKDSTTDTELSSNQNMWLKI